MFLTRLVLNPRVGSVQRDLANPWQMHRTIYRAFPDTLPQGERLLFRVEPTNHSGAPVVLVQSVSAPNWAFLEQSDAHGWGYLLDIGEANPAVRPLDLGGVMPGDVLQFRLWANPTVRRDGKRLGILDEEEQIQWLQRKGRAAGFAVVAVRIGRQQFVEGFQPGAGRLSLYGVQFDGRFRVVNHEVLTKAVERGIGSGKGLGFGLLSLARVRRE